MQSEKRRPPRNNPWGSRSYADLITQAIESSSEKRLTLSQIYDWMVRNVPYFGNQANSNSSAGWKNSIRHNLSLHKKFLRVKNDEGVCKSSWWTVTKSEGIERTSRKKKLSKKKPKIIFGRQNPLYKKLSTLDPPSRQSSALFFKEDCENSSIQSASNRNGFLRPKKTSTINDSVQIACPENCPTSAESQIFCQKADSSYSIHSSISSYSSPHSFDNRLIPVTDDASLLLNPHVYNQTQQFAKEQSICNQSADSGNQINFLEDNFAMEEHFKYPHHLSGSYMRTVTRNDSTQNFAASFETSGFIALQGKDSNVLQQPLQANYSQINQKQISANSLSSVQTIFNEGSFIDPNDRATVKQTNEDSLQDTFVSSATMNASPDINYAETTYKDTMNGLYGDPMKDIPTKEALEINKWQTTNEAASINPRDDINVSTEFDQFSNFFTPTNRRICLNQYPNIQLSVLCQQPFISQQFENERQAVENSHKVSLDEEFLNTSNLSIKKSINYLKDDLNGTISPIFNAVEISIDLNQTISDRIETTVDDISSSVTSENDLTSGLCVTNQRCINLQSKTIENSYKVQMGRSTVTRKRTRKTREVFVKNSRRKTENKRFPNYDNNIASDNDRDPSSFQDCNLEVPFEQDTNSYNLPDVIHKEQEQFNSALQNFCGCISFEKVFQNTMNTKKNKRRRNSLADRGSQNSVHWPEEPSSCSSASNKISETSNSSEIGKNKTSEQCKLIMSIYYESCKNISQLNQVPTGSENFKGVKEKILFSKLIEFSEEKSKELSLPSNYIQKVFSYLEECLPPKVFLVIVTEFSFALACTTKEYQDDKSFYVNSNAALTAFLRAHDDCVSTEHILNVYLFTLLSIISAEFCEMLLGNSRISDLDLQEDMKYYFEQYLLRIKNIDQKYNKGIPLINTHLGKILNEIYFPLPSQTQGLSVNLAYPHLKNLLGSSSNCYTSGNPSPLITDNSTSSSTDSYSSPDSFENGHFAARNCSLPPIPHGLYASMAMRQMKRALDVHNECSPMNVTNMESTSSQPSVNHIMLTHVYDHQSFLSQNSLPNSAPQNILDALHLMQRDSYPTATANNAPVTYTSDIINVAPVLDDSATLGVALAPYDSDTANVAPGLVYPANVNVNFPYLSEEEYLANVDFMGDSTTVSVTSSCMDNMENAGGLTLNEAELDYPMIASIIFSYVGEMRFSDISEATETIEDKFNPQNYTIGNECENLQGHIPENKNTVSILNLDNHQESDLQKEEYYPEDLINIDLYTIEYFGNFEEYLDTLTSEDYEFPGLNFKPFDS